MIINKSNLLIKVSEKCFLKVIKTKDITEQYINWMNDYDVVKFTQQKKINHTRENVSKFVNEKLISNNDYLFGIFYNNNHIGNIKLGPINWDKKSSEISFVIGEKLMWGQGIGSSVVSKVIEFAINEINITKISGNYYQENIGSLKIFNKCGFLIEKKDNNMTWVIYKKQS